MNWEYEYVEGTTIGITMSYVDDSLNGIDVSDHVFTLTVKNLTDNSSNNSSAIINKTGTNQIPEAGVVHFPFDVDDTNGLDGLKKAEIEMTDSDSKTQSIIFTFRIVHNVKDKS